MRRTLRLAIMGLGLVAGAAAAAGPDVNGPPRRSTDLPRPRDGDIAVQEELDVARKARTIAAYDLFIARHPGHRLAVVARRERARLGR